MQTIHIDVNENYSQRVLNMLESLKGIMLQDIRVERTVKVIDDSSKELIDAQERVMAKLWDNEEDEAWNDL